MHGQVQSHPISAGSAARSVEGAANRVVPESGGCDAESSWEAWSVYGGYFCVGGGRDAGGFKKILDGAESFSGETFAVMFIDCFRIPRCQ